MKKEQIRDLYKKKIKEFKHHNLLYFKKNNPKLTDGDFDKLKNEILLLENNYLNIPSETNNNKSRIKIIKGNKNKNQATLVYPLLQSKFSTQVQTIIYTNFITNAKGFSIISHS